MAERRTFSQVHLHSKYRHPPKSPPFDQIEEMKTTDRNVDRYDDSDRDILTTAKLCPAMVKI